MDTNSLAEKATEKLSPFETGHVVQFVKGLTVKSALGNPWIVGAFLIILFYAVVVRSKFVLCALFTAISLLLLVHYTMPTESDSLALSSTLPFAFGGIAIGGFIIYLYFIKTE
ncbi:hypothetical protein GMLC_24060 [Geomonas limicola]|uniref:Uncharacterized protein n=1 Tax=Geomonas limicola TaxID=2740186 RepID=A0A6V8NAJ0_9BACT|nr:hypothetical protein [Geomonas limicola]GFO68827.1 hypothetical protein GMLC_24060 [Geomonas limicola]